MDRPLPQWFDLLAYDQRGYGQTDKPDIAYSMQDYADDAAALLDELGWDKCHVIGVSFGGMVAQEFAIRYPERINRLVLAVTSSGAEGEASLPLHELANFLLRKLLANSLIDWIAVGMKSGRKEMPFCIKLYSTICFDRFFVRGTSVPSVHWRLVPGITRLRVSPF